MFDKKTMKEIAMSAQNMSQEEAKERTEKLKKLLDDELEKRAHETGASAKKRGKLFQWIKTLWKDD